MKNPQYGGGFVCKLIFKFASIWEESLEHFDWISEKMDSQVIALYWAFCQLATMEAWMMKIFGQ